METTESVTAIHSLSDLPCDAQTKIVLFRWLFGMTRQKAFIDHVGNSKMAREIIGMATESGYVMLNCKLYAYWYHYYGYANPDKFGISRQDATLLKRLELSFTEAIKPMSLERYNTVASRFFSSQKLQTYVGKFVYRKMRFLSNYGHQAVDIKAMLLEKAWYALLKQYPMYKSPLHYVNIAKTTIHNTGQTFITSQTRAKRQVLTKDSDGQHLYIFDNIENHLEVTADTPDPEIENGIKVLVNESENMPPRVQRYLSIMAGMHDPEFSIYLKRDNQEAIEKLDYDKYRMRLEAFMGISRERSDALFAHLRARLA